MTNNEQVAPCDVLIIGSGLAGLALALKLPESLNICIVTKKRCLDCASYYAQGGIAAAIDAHDSVDKHLDDTLRAGAGLVDTTVARNTLQQASAAIDWLRTLGVPFTTSTDRRHLHLHQEGGHTQRRVAHVNDNTGQAIMTVLAALIQARTNITLLVNTQATQLLTQDERSPVCVGAQLYHHEKRHYQHIACNVCVLATGGASQVYQHTTAPETATGDGIALAWHAGCRVANMEFCQFHPTCLYHPQHKRQLITEALRGEGARLILPDGSRFMQQYHPQAELAPRDIVARAIHTEMEKNGLEHVALDISHRDATTLRTHFPTVDANCRAAGIDICTMPIPVVPASHYTCGGVITDQTGQTDVQDLFAIGEVAYTGLHGANRMASNSLLECCVFAQNARTAIVARCKIKKSPAITVPTHGTAPPPTALIDYAKQRATLQRLMWQNVGIVRCNARLAHAQRHITAWHEQLAKDGQAYCTIPFALQQQHLILTVANLIVTSAIARHESRGAHYNRDYPNQQLNNQQPTIMMAQPNPPSATSVAGETVIFACCPQIKPVGNAVSASSNRR